MALMSYVFDEPIDCFSNDGAFTHDGILFLLKHDISGLTTDIFRKYKFNIYELEQLPKLDFTYKTNMISQNKNFQKYQNLVLDDLKFLEKHEYASYIFQNFSKFNEVTDAELCCWVIVLCCNPAALFIYEMLTDIKILFATRKSRNKWLKQLHNNIRVTDQWYTGQHVNPDTALHLQYLNMCLSRDDFGEDDLLEDMLKRGKPTSRKEYVIRTNNKYFKSRNKYYNVLESKLDQMFSKALINFNFKELITLKEFIMMSELWVTSGSASGAKTTDGVLLNKRGAFEFGYITYDSLIESPANTWVTTTTKYENGKTRALYPTDVTSYTMSSYVLYFIEKYMNNIDGYCANLANNKQLLSELMRQKYVDEDEICYMWDFTDFNYTHELDSLALVYRCILKWFKKHIHDIEILTDLEFVCNWLIKATYNHYLTDKNNSITIKRECSLMSGARDTSFMNTTLNIAYVLVVEENVKDLINRSIIKNYYCMGDDQYITLYKDIDCYLYRYMMLAHGHDGNMIKITRRGEFLRYSMTKENGIKGFLNRSLVNLVTRDQNRTDYKNPINVPNGYIVQAKKCISRGSLKIIGDILKVMLNKHTKVFNENEDKYKMLTFDYISSMKINNGMGIANLDNELNNNIWNRNIFISDIALKERIVGLPHIMTDNYFKWLKNKIGYEIYDKELMKQVMVSNYSSFRGPSERALNKIDIYNQVCGLKIVGEYKVDVGMVNIAKKCCDDVVNSMIKLILNPYVLDSWQYNEFSTAKKLLTISSIKRIDVFKYIVRKCIENEQIGEMKAVIRILEICDVPMQLIRYICGFIPKFGIDMVLDMLYDNFNYDVILDGIVRDSWQVIIKDLELKYIWNYMYKTDISTLNISLLISLCEREILTKIVNDNFIRRYTCS